METFKTEMGSIFLLLAVLAISIVLTSCGEEETLVDSTPDSIEETLLKITEESEEIASFENNYNEEGTIEMSLAKISENIYPKKIAQKMHPIGKTFTTTILGDSACAVYTRTYEGQLIIVASTIDGGPADTVIYKPFITQITRNLIFKKVYNTNIDTNEYHWKITSISLPEGGTGNTSIILDKMSVFLPNGDTITVTSPNDYYLTHSGSNKNRIPNFNNNEKVKVRLELISSQAEQEYVTLTCNGNKNGLNKMKKQFEFISSEHINFFYKKVYEGYWMTNNFSGHYHAIINALTAKSIEDDSSPVESASWGIPYKVN